MIYFVLYRNLICKYGWIKHGKEWVGTLNSSDMTAFGFR